MSLYFPRPQFAAFLALGLLVISIHSASATNMLVDPGFENWTDPSTPTDWGVFLGSSDTVSQETSTVFSGLSSMKTTAADSGFPGAFNDTTNFGFGVAPGDIYEASVWVYSESALPEFTATLEMKYDSADVFRVPFALSSLPTNQWVKISNEFTVPAGKSFATFSVITLHDFVTFNGNTAVVYYDDASVQLVPEPASLSFVALGIVGIEAYRRRTRQ